LTLPCPCGEQLYTEYKFGVLYYKDGQTNEDDMFGNVDTSPEYEEFLQLLGQKVCLPSICYTSPRSCARSNVLNALRVTQVRLQGWKQYAAGLDTEKNQTGTHSIFTTWEKYVRLSFGMPWPARSPHLLCSPLAKRVQP
jgi:hypothetical protein